MLTEAQCAIIENALTSAVEPRKVAAYLCLHMGLMLSEVAALRLEDIDLRGGTVAVNSTDIKKADDGEPCSTETPSTRILPMPPQVRRYMNEHAALYSAPECYIMSGETKPVPFYLMQNVLNTVNKKHIVGETLSAMDLRNAFIRRCIQSGMDLYSLCTYIGVKQPNVILKRFGEYFSVNYDALYTMEKFCRPGDCMDETDIASRRGMNLLILGAGSQGPVVMEIAQSLGIFSRIDYLDDDPDKRAAIGPLSDYERLREIYPVAIASFGNSALRREYYDKLIAAGYVIPRLIHPTASISGSSVKLGKGVVVEPKVIIGNNVTVEDNVILSAGCVLDRGCVIHANAHVGCACTITRGSHVAEGQRIPSGMVFDNSYDR